ncbi:Pimeloyl-ACP methyl ester carboxylesterase [Enhydrobacter aerosaccus]|uniref:Pimeloyl-ACP methyl ester carboxylesterase n=1 Tax=Enhydrobacter aerosaccus TaxID=225324 RepID=A0A1T4SWK6_9HYPH|nr:alpha/beta hydrolase [Enhydrobacter aerosaccus]SKA32547.1 Pimeloyl-ACP methyl ester carboxylesterase [Enhydrobacter aerosaccus]
MTKTPLLLVPGLLCSPRLFAPQVAALSDIADIVVPDWRKAPLSIFDSWGATARWILDQMPPGRFALAGLSLGGMISVEIMQIAAERVSKLALLDTGMRAQNDTEKAIRRARVRLADDGNFELVLGLQLARFLPAYRLPDKALVDEVMMMCRETGVEIYKRQEELAAVRVDRRPDLPKITCPTVVVCGRDDVTTPLAFSEEIAAGITGSELAVIEQCGHLVTMEKPAETNAILRRWLSR